MLRPDFDDYRGIERASAQQPYAPKGGKQSQVIPHHRNDIMIDFVDDRVGKHLIKSHPAAVLGTNMELSGTPGVRHYRYASAV